MKILRLILVLCIALAVQAQADDRKTLFDALGLRLVSTVDPMTDKSQCALFFYPAFGPVYLSIEGTDKVTIWPRVDGLFFASDADHFIRIGESAPFKLQVLAKRNGLALADSAEAAALIKALAKGERVRVRYVEWPSYEKVDLGELSNFALPYVWSIASEKCGWPSLGVPSDLPPATLHIYESEDPSNKGYAAITVNNNDDLGLLRSFEKYGGGCQITLKHHESVGFNKGKWTSEAVDRNGRIRLVVRDKSGNVVFDEKVPTEYGSGSPTLWPKGAEAARAMWRVAPIGSVELEGDPYHPKAMLYGFRELWSWGIQNCSLPSLEK